ncbi:MAG: hypothetical protein AB7K24_21695 [Gemmataceae bacterium]
MTTPAMRLLMVFPELEKYLTTDEVEERLALAGISFPDDERWRQLVAERTISEPPGEPF